MITELNGWRRWVGMGLVVLGLLALLGTTYAMFINDFLLGLSTFNLSLSAIIGGAAFGLGPWLKRSCMAAVSLVAGLGALLGHLEMILPSAGALTFALVGVILIDRIWSAKEEVVTISPHGVERLSGHIHETIRWENLIEVGIVTTSDGPFVEDFFWLLCSADGTGVSVPNGSAQELLKVLQNLPGFDNMAVIMASGCTDDASFTPWTGARGDATGIVPILYPSLKINDPTGKPGIECGEEDRVDRRRHRGVCK